MAARGDATRRRFREAVLVVNAAGQVMGLAQSQGVRVPGFPPPFTDLHAGGRNPVALELVTGVIGPNAIGMCLVTSLAVLLTGETDACAPYLALTYYHLSNTLSLGRLALQGKPSTFVGDPAPGAAFHGVLFVLMAASFATAVWDRASAARRRNKAE